MESLITCPDCKFSKSEPIPQDFCLYFYECTNCHKVMRPAPGDCCVLCAYGTVKCPFTCHP
ncbi:MAG TPA: GDCCVxC domain-containing (seleno)protein [Terriglobia bacterium]|nr:GDCCVxC domain-containing (seleno)protein [Terriglobia bacterium]